MFGLQIKATILPLLKSLKSKEAYFRITMIYLVERLFGIAISFIVYTALARVYGPTLIGTYSYVQTVMLFAVPFLATGAEGVIIREIVRAGSSLNELMGSAFAVLAVTGLVTTLIPLAAIWLFQGDQKSLLYMAMFTAAGFVPTAFLVTEQAFKAEQKPMPVVIARVGSALLGAAAKLYLIYFRYPIESVVAATAAEAFVLTGLLLCLYARQHSISSWRFDAGRASYIFRQCFPGMIASIAIMLFFRANHVLLVYLSGFDAVGQYAVAFQSSQLFLVLPHVFFGAIYPRLVHLHTHDPKRYRIVLNICYLVFSVAAYLILVVCLLFAKDSFRVVFGTKYDVASQIIIILAATNIFNFSGAVRGRAIDIANATHYHVWNSLIGLAIVIPTSWLVIPSYGPIGAVLCIGLALFVSGILTSFFLPAVREDAMVQIKALFLIPSFKLSDI